jgi:KDO2-lipid IV(A) lauroyltransferase
MYHIVYGIFYLLSLLPWRVMYFIGDGIYALVFYVFGYRKEVVMKNLLIAFPEKTEKERLRIAKDFYHNFIDTFIETIKLLSISSKEFDKRCTANAEVVNDLYATGQSVQLHTGHFFNWEFGNLSMGKTYLYPFLGVYQPLSNKIFNRLIIKLRSKFGTILIPVPEFKTSFHQYTKEPYALGLVADQNPSNPNNAYWVPFFGKMAPFVKGPEKGAVRMNTAVVMVDYYKVKRGYYRMEYTLLTTTPKEFKEGEITKKLIEFIEACVRKRPSNYLWSHRRWKYEFDEEKYGKLVIK